MHYSLVQQEATTWMDPVLTILSEDILKYMEGELLALRILQLTQGRVPSIGYPIGSGQS